MSNNDNIKSLMETVERIFEATYITVEKMPDGSRMQIKELAEAVGAAVTMEPKQVLGFVSHFAHNTDIAYVTRGKNGGIIRGTKPVKVVKVSKKDKATDATSTDPTV